MSKKKTKKDPVQELRPAPHLIGYTIVKKTVEFTSAQTGATVWQPASGKMIAVTDFNITTGGLTAGLVTLWCGTAGDTTYTAGTDETVFRGEFAPGTASRPGAIKTYDVQLGRMVLPPGQRSPVFVCSQC